jgi:hypothetical protein
VKQSAIPLFTAQEAEKLRLLDAEWKVVDEILTRRQALSTRGPLIAVRSPSVQPTKPIPTIETTTPIHLAVHFLAHEAPVKLQTLEACGKAWGFQRCFMDKLKPYLNAYTPFSTCRIWTFPRGSMSSKFALPVRRDRKR